MQPDARAHRALAREAAASGVVRAGLATLVRISGRGKPAVPARAERYQGLVEEIAGGRVTGWVFDPASPLRRVVVSVIDGEGGRVRAIADRYRADLQLAGFGDGHVGFSIPLRGEQSPRVVAGPDDEPLPKGSVELCSPMTGAELRQGTVVLGLDPPHLSGRRLSGWGIDFRDPSRPLRLGLTAGGRLLSETRASRYRPDRADAFCGFVLDHPGDERELDLIHLPGGTRLAALR